MKHLTGNELRESFLAFFESKRHKRLPSASLVPEGDPTLLLTGAGMVPFKPFFLGQKTPEYRRVTTCQRCLRTGDIDNVGKTDRHATFFEMLGNFSFGDYFKKEVIPWAWEFVTQHLEFPKDRLWVTVFQDDDEAFSIWENDIGIPRERIIRLGKKDNFWEIGVGPCGPCSEIYLDRGPEHGCGKDTCRPGCDCDRFLEFWNMVFIQFYQDEKGNLTPLEQKGIDTGMGLERTAALLQGVKTIFDTDLVRSLLEAIASLVGRKYGEDPKVDSAIRVITDHSRGITFLINDGVFPSNEGRGYVLRRLLRRAVRFGRLLGIREPFLGSIADKVIELMLPGYPELKGRNDYIKRIINLEEEKFNETLDQGVAILEELVEGLKREGKTQIPGSEAFRLYDTFGFPLELTKEIAAENQVEVDEEGFQEYMESQRQRARASRENLGYMGVDSSLYIQLRKAAATEFVGYETTETEATVAAIIKEGKTVPKVTAGQEVEIVLDRTPFYPESGGQVADTGTITGMHGAVNVTHTSRPVEGFIVHKGTIVSGELRTGDVVLATVDRQERLNSARNHSATHLLHAALRELLGKHVEQAGSLVAPKRLRFDFTHFEALSPEQLDEIQRRVNLLIMENIPVQIHQMSRQEAKDFGAIGLFEGKYGEYVRVVAMGDYSKELCGGTHVTATGDIGLFRVVSEGSVASGVRRIEALTGEHAYQFASQEAAALRQVASVLQVGPAEILNRLERIQAEVRELQRENETLRRKMASSLTDQLIAQAETAGEAKVVVAAVEKQDANGLRSLGDQLKGRLPSSVIFLASERDGKLLFMAMASQDLVSRGVHAGSLVKEAARITGGGGGGRPDMAQAGGREVTKLNEALSAVKEVVLKQLQP